MSKTTMNAESIIAAGEAFLLTEQGKDFKGPVTVSTRGDRFMVTVASDTEPVAMSTGDVSGKDVRVSLPVEWERCF